MTSSKQIPESKIALNPVVINDSFRQSKEHRCPLDEHALVERLKEWELEAHNAREDITTVSKGKPDYEELLRFTSIYAQEVAYHRVINLIQNGRVRQMHRTLVPRGWSEVD